VSECWEFIEVDVQNSLTEKLTGDQLEVYDTFSGYVVVQPLEDERTRQLLMSGCCE